MTIPLTDGTNTINLPPDMTWIDQVYTPVEQEEDDFSLDGSLHLDPFIKQAGRPITLAGGENYAWVKWQMVLDLLAWAQDPTKDMTITIDGTGYPVRFSYSKNEGPITAISIWGLNPPKPEDDYYITLRLITV